VDEAILETARECWNKDSLLRVGTKERSESAEKDTGVGTYRGFGIDLHFCEYSEEVIVQNPIR
jgi:hypothetical protein